MGVGGALHFGGSRAVLEVGTCRILERLKVAGGTGLLTSTQQDASGWRVGMSAGGMREQATHPCLLGEDSIPQQF